MLLHFLPCCIFSVRSLCGHGWKIRRSIKPPTLFCMNALWRESDAQRNREIEKKNNGTTFLILKKKGKRRKKMQKNIRKTKNSSQDHNKFLNKIYFFLCTLFITLFFFSALHFILRFFSFSSILQRFYATWATWTTSQISFSIPALYDFFVFSSPLRSSLGLVLVAVRITCKVMPRSQVPNNNLKSGKSKRIPFHLLYILV